MIPMETSTSEQWSRDTATLLMMNFTVNISLELFQHFQMFKKEFVLIFKDSRNLGSKLYNLVFDLFEMSYVSQC